MEINYPYSNYYDKKPTYKDYFIKDLLDIKSLIIKELLEKNPKKEVLEKLYSLWLLGK